MRPRPHICEALTKSRALCEGRPLMLPIAFGAGAGLIPIGQVKKPRRVQFAYLARHQSVGGGGLEFQAQLPGAQVRF